MPRISDQSKPRGSVDEKLTGRKLFHSSLTYPKLTQRFNNGAKLKKTELTEEFDYEDFRELYGETATPLLMIDENRELKVCAADVEPSPKEGQTLIGLVDRVPNQEDTA